MPSRSPSVRRWWATPSSEVVESKNRAFAPGDFVAGYDGWQQFGLSNGAGLRKIDPSTAPISTAIGVLGMPGMTAYVGLLDIGRPKAGETVVVSAAAGAVGAVVGQIARIHGCRVVGIAGSKEKCDYVVEELGFDACVNHRDPELREALRAACPDGIDVYFENVGGAVFEAVLPLLNMNARIPLCGLIAEYNATEPPRAASLRPILITRALIKGFIVYDHADRMPDFVRDCTSVDARRQIEVPRGRSRGPGVGAGCVNRSSRWQELRQAPRARLTRSDIDPVGGCRIQTIRPTSGSPSTPPSHRSTPNRCG